MEVTCYCTWTLSRIAFCEEKLSLKENESAYALVLNDLRELKENVTIYLVCLQFNYTEMQVKSRTIPLCVYSSRFRALSKLQNISDTQSNHFAYCIFNINCKVIDSKLVCDEDLVRRADYYCRVLKLKDTIYKELLDKDSVRIKWPSQSQIEYEKEKRDYVRALSDYHKDIIKYCNTIRNKEIKDSNLNKKLK